MGEIYKYDYDHKLFILLDGREHSVGEHLQRSLNKKDQKWLWVEVPFLSYRVPTKSPFLYIEGRTSCYVYHDINSDDILFRTVPSL